VRPNDVYFKTREVRLVPSELLVRAGLVKNSFAQRRPAGGSATRRLSWLTYISGQTSLLSGSR
jgi:hypothetical protein